MRTRITHGLTNVILTLLVICLVAAECKTKAKKESSSLKHLKRLSESQVAKPVSKKSSEPKQRQLDLSQPKSSDQLNQPLWNQLQLGVYPNYYQSQLPLLNYYNQPSGYQTYQSINPYSFPINPGYFYSPLLPNFHNLPNITTVRPEEGTPSDVEIVTPILKFPNNQTYPNFYDIFRNTPLGPLFPQSPISPQTPHSPNPIYPVNPIFKQDPTSTQKPISPENPASPQTPINSPLFPFFPQNPLLHQTPYFSTPISPDFNSNPIYKQSPTSTQKPSSSDNPTSPQTPIYPPLGSLFPQNPLFQQSPFLPNPLIPNLELNPIYKQNPTSTQKPNSPEDTISQQTPLQQYPFFPMHPIFRLNPSLPQSPTSTETSISSDKSHQSPNLPNPTSPIPPVYSENPIFRQNPIFAQNPIYASTHGAPSIFPGPFSQPISPNPYSYEYYYNNLGQAYGLPGFRPFFYDGFYKNVNETKCLNATGPCDPFDYPTLKSNSPIPVDKSKIIEVINRLYKQDPNIVIFNTKEPPPQRQFDDIPEDLKEDDIRIGKDSDQAESDPFYQAYKDVMHINKSVLSTFAPYFYRK